MSFSVLDKFLTLRFALSDINIATPDLFLVNVYIVYHSLYPTHLNMSSLERNEIISSLLQLSPYLIHFQTLKYRDETSSQI